MFEYYGRSWYALACLWNQLPDTFLVWLIIIIIIVIINEKINVAFSPKTEGQ